MPWSFPLPPPPQEKEGKTCRRCNSSPAFQRPVGKKGSKTEYSSLTKKNKEMSFVQKESATCRKRSSAKRLKRGSKNKKRPSGNASAFIRCHSSHTCNRPIGEKCSRNTWAPGGSRTSPLPCGRKTGTHNRKILQFFYFPPPFPSPIFTVHFFLASN